MVRIHRTVQKDLHDPDNHDGVITHLEPDILECKIKWALGSIAMNQASGGNGTLVKLFQILKDDAVKVLHSIWRQIWKTQQWPQDWNRSIFTPIPKKSESEVTHLRSTVCYPMDCSLGILCPWDFPGKSTVVGCHFFLQILKKGNAKEC